MHKTTTSLVCGNASHFRTGSRPTTVTAGMGTELVGAVYLPFMPIIVAVHCTLAVDFKFSQCYVTANGIGVNYTVIDFLTVID